MKKILLSIALAFVAPFAWAQVSETTTTTTTTDANGTITEFDPPSSTFSKTDSFRTFGRDFNLPEIPMGTSEFCEKSMKGNR